MARTPIQFAVAATGTFTVSDYQYLAGLDSTTTITITNYAVMTGGNFNFGGGFIVLTEGVDFNAVTSNNVTAGNVATAINTAAGGTIAVAVGAVITVSLPGENDGLSIVWTGGAGVTPTTATLSGGFDSTQIRLGSIPIIGIFGDDIAIGASNAACATNIATYINSRGEPITAVATNNVVTLTYTSVGTAGNSYAIVVQAANGGIASGGCTASGATLSGGLAGTTPRTAATGRTDVANLQNLLLQSQVFDNASWVKTRTTVTANSVVAPDGTTTADTYQDTNAGVNTYLMVQSPTMSIGYVHTFSVWAKKGTLNWLYLNADGGTKDGYFDLLNGVVGSSTLATLAIRESSLYPGWYQCSMTFTSTSGSGIRIYLANADGGFMYNGDGTGTIYVWQAQLVQANWVGAQTVTTASPVTTPIRSLATTRTQV